MPENEAQKAAIDDMLGTSSNDEVVDDPTTDDASATDEGDAGTTEGSVDAGIPPAADGVTDAEGSVATGEPSTTDTSQSGGEPAAGATDDTIVDDIAALRQRIADMSTPVQPAVASVDTPEDPLAVFKDNVDYITAENLAGIADNPLLLNDAMNDVRRQTAENILSIVPNLIQTAIQTQAQRTELHNTFYGANPELVPYKAYVSVVAKEMQEKLKDKTQEEILVAVAKSVKTSLKLETVKPKAKKGGAKPALRTKNGGARVTTTPVDDTSMAAQIMDLL